MKKLILTILFMVMAVAGFAQENNLVTVNDSIY